MTASASLSMAARADGILAPLGIDRDHLQVATPCQALADLQPRGAGLAVDEDLADPWFKPSVKAAKEKGAPVSRSALSKHDIDAS